MRDKSNDIPIGSVLKPQAIAAAGNATGAYVAANKGAWIRGPLLGGRWRRHRQRGLHHRPGDRTPAAPESRP
jgi:hypothetical protein